MRKEAKIFIVQLPKTGVAITYNPQERSIEVSVKDVPLFRLLPSDTIIEYSLSQSGQRPKFMAIGGWRDIGRFEKHLKVFYSAIIEDVANLHTWMALKKEGDKNPESKGPYTAILIETNKLQGDPP